MKFTMKKPCKKENKCQLVSYWQDSFGSQHLGVCVRAVETHIRGQFGLESKSLGVTKLILGKRKFHSSHDYPVSGKRNEIWDPSLKIYCMFLLVVWVWIARKVSICMPIGERLTTAIKWKKNQQLQCLEKIYHVMSSQRSLYNIFAKLKSYVMMYRELIF